MASLSDLHEEIAKVCPIVSLSGSVGRAPKSIVFAEGATRAQKDAAQAVIQSFDWAKEPSKPLALTDDEIRWIRDQMKARLS